MLQLLLHIPVGQEHSLRADYYPEIICLAEEVVIDLSLHFCMCAHESRVPTCES